MISLNERQTREKYKAFEGRYTEQMPVLIKENRITLSMKQIIERRINSKQNDWRNNWFDTCDAIAYGKNGKFKIIKNCEMLKQINPKTKLKNGAIPTTEKEYNKLKGKEFDCSEISLNRLLTKTEALTHHVWKYLLEEHLKEYIELAFKHDNLMMGVWTNKEEFCVRAFCVGRLDDGSGLSGRHALDGDFGRLVGIASEMQEKET